MTSPNLGIDKTRFIELFLIFAQRSLESMAFYFTYVNKYIYLLISSSNTA